MQIGIKLEKIGKQIYWEVLCSPVSSLFLCPIFSLFLIPIFLFFPKINIFNFYRNRRKLCIITFWHSLWRSILAFSLASSLQYSPTWALPYRKRQCSLRSRARSWRPTVPADIWSSQLRSGSAHWDLELAVEVRQCPLRSEVRQCPLRSEVRLRSGSAHWDLRSAWGPAVPTEIWGPAVPTEIWGPAVPTEIWSSQLRSGSAHCDLEFAVEVRKCERDLQFTVGGRRKEKGWRRRRKEEGRRKEEVTLIKSRDPVFLCFLCVSIFLWCPIYIYIFIYIYIRSFVLSRFGRIL